MSAGVDEPGVGLRRACMSGRCIARSRLPIIKPYNLMHGSRRSFSGFQRNSHGACECACESHAVTHVKSL